MRQAQTKFDCQPPRDLPRILPKKLKRVIGNVIEPIEIGFVVVGYVASDHVRVNISVTLRVIRQELHPPVGVVVGWLRISNPLVEKARFKSVVSNDLSDRVTNARHPLVGIESGRLAPGFEPAGIKHKRRFTAASAASERGDLLHRRSNVPEQTSVAIAD